MIATIKRTIRHLLGIKNDTDYYGQAGEDAIISKTFSFVVPVKNGRYVDVGSFHPYRHSNTYILYKSGWTGINIDPRPGSKALFDRHRPKDINIEAGIAAENSTMTYYMISENSTMNTFSRKNLEDLGMYDQVKQTIDIPVFSLHSLLEKYPEINTIDYLNIDAEGFEMEILHGMDFNKYAPKVISIEQNGFLTLKEVEETDAAVFLEGKGYVAYAKNVLLKNVATVFYLKKDALG